MSSTKAADLMIFSNASVQVAESIKILLHEFKHSTGLGTNCDKSRVFFSNCDSSIRVEIEEILGFREHSLPITYLGLPLFSSWISSSDCQPLINKFRGKLSVWKSHILSFAGRLDLIPSMLSSLHLY